MVKARKYKTGEEQVKARRDQNRRAQKRYRERRKCQANTTPSTDTDEPRAKKRTNRRLVGQASKDVGRLETQCALSERPSAEVMVEVQLTRIMEDLESFARTLQSTTDSPAIEYMRKQRPRLQRVIDILTVLQGDRSEPAEVSFGNETISSAADSNHHLPVQLTPVPDCQPSSNLASKAPKPSSGEMLRSLRAQLPLLASLGWGDTLGIRTVPVSRISQGGVAVRCE
ncbi:hypothetical protein PMIN01_12100 [Paraphaeosphaeria minitans]|uniref:BZIP domain-containing protein n=1 Tax=Paraphaeosphaeria minitans TaxID=565426 RepID=A0A9P6G792_9PLEO|nr:hypothetical protein PMIN01_12100 [Paraphaeosphaeria minitans]